MTTLKTTILEFKEETTFQINNKTYRRQMVTCTLFESSEKLFIEFRDDLIDKVKDFKLIIGDSVWIQIEFKGSEKGDKYFNNIVAKNLGYEWEK